MVTLREALRRKQSVHAIIFHVPHENYKIKHKGVCKPSTVKDNLEWVRAVTEYFHFILVISDCQDNSRTHTYIHNLVVLGF